MFTDFDRHVFAKLLPKDTNIKGKENASRPRFGQKKKKRTPNVTYMKNVICLLLY